MNAASRSARYRAGKKARAPGFQDRLDRAIASINASKDNEEVMKWCEAAAAEVWNDGD